MLQAQQQLQQRPRRSCQKSRDHMIIHYKDEYGVCCDWERPHVRVSKTKTEFLTPEQSSWLPVHTFKMMVLSSTDHPQHKHKNYATFQFNATKISKEFPALCRISYFQHLGMRTFAMGTHNRLGADSPVKNLHRDIIKMIGRYAGEY